MARKRIGITVTLDSDVHALLVRGAQGAMLPTSRFLERILIEYARNNPAHFAQEPFKADENHDVSQANQDSGSGDLAPPGGGDDPA